MFRTVSPIVAVAALSFTLAGCGGGPPSDVVTAEITDAVFNANTAMFVGTKENAEVVSIKVGKWEKEKFGDMGTLYQTTWTAKLRFKEPVACILAEYDGKHIVKIVAEKGDELPMEGRCGGGQSGKKWDLGAHVNIKDGIMGAGPWKPIYEKVPDLKMGYPVIQSGRQTGAKFRNQNFEPLSKLKPYVIEGSEEFKKMMAEAEARAKKAQEEAAERARIQREQLQAQQLQRQQEAEERQRQYQEQVARQQAEAAERQRLAQEEYARKQAEAAEAARIAREQAIAKAAAEKHARLLAVMKPLQSATGAIITAEAGQSLGTVLLDATIDEEKLSVSGNAIDLREMPFKEFTYTGSVDDRGTFSFRSSLGGEPVAYNASGEKLASRAGFTISPLAPADRSRMESLIALGRRLGSAAPLSLAVETIDAEAAKTREPQLRLSGLNGQVIYRKRLDTRVNPLFAADMASNRSYAWKGGETVAVRLAEPASGTGIFIRGTSAASTELVVTINGVHKATIPSIPKLGGVIIAVPNNLEILDVALQATGSVTARTIGLVK